MLLNAQAAIYELLKVSHHYYLFYYERNSHVLGMTLLRISLRFLAVQCRKCTTKSIPNAKSIEVVNLKVLTVLSHRSAKIFSTLNSLLLIQLKLMAESLIVTNGRMSVQIFSNI